MTRPIAIRFLVGRSTAATRWADGRNRASRRGARSIERDRFGQWQVSSLGHAVSPDGKRVIVNPATGRAVGFGFDGTGPRPVAGLDPEDVPLRFDGTGRYLFTMVTSAMTARIMRIDLTTGERSTWRELSPVDPSGAMAVDRVRISADGTAYVYSIRRVTSNVALITDVN